MATMSPRCRRGSVSGDLEGAPFAAVADDERRLYGVQFHPEVVHTEEGGRCCRVSRWMSAAVPEAGR